MGILSNELCIADVIYVKLSEESVSVEGACMKFFLGKERIFHDLETKEIVLGRIANSGYESANLGRFEDFYPIRTAIMAEDWHLENGKHVLDTYMSICEEFGYDKFSDIEIQRQKKYQK